MKLGERLLNNQWLALGIIFIASGMPLTGWLAGIILVLITLRQGISAGAFGLLAGVLGLLVSSFVIDPLVTGNQLEPSLIGIFLHLPPLFIMAVVLRMRISLSQALAVGAGYYMIFALVLNAADALPTTQMLMNSVGQQLEQAFVQSEVQQGVNPQTVDQQTAQIVNDVVVTMSYSWIAILYLANCILLFIGRSWQARLFNPGGFRTEFHNLRLSLPVLAAALVLALTVTYSQHISFVIVVCGVIASVLLMFPGLGLIHWYIQNKKRSVMWLVAFYMLFLLNFIMPVVIVITLTIVDAFVDVRQRIQKKS